MACEYCTESKNLEPAENTNFCDLAIVTAKNWVPCLTVGSLFDKRRFYPINYCPMCGEKLGDTNE